MAYILYQSTQSNTGSSATLAITKPVSLAVGDLMVAVIMADSGTSIASTGWTSIASKTSTVIMTAFYKIADASDVAATNFTFTITGGSPANTHGTISRLVAAASSLPVDQFNTGNGSGTSVSVAGITSTIPNSFYMICLAYVQSSGAGSASNTSAQAVTTTNPTWTEIYDASTGTGGGSFIGMSIAYASRSPATATGNVTATYSTATSSYVSIVFNLTPALVAALSMATSVQQVNTPYGPMSPLHAAMTVGAPTYTETPSMFRNQTKHTVAVKNQAKS